MNIIETHEAQTNLIKHYDWTIEKTNEEIRLLDIEIEKLQALEKKRKELNNIALRSKIRRDDLIHLGPLPTIKELQEIKQNQKLTR